MAPASPPSSRRPPSSSGYEPTAQRAIDPRRHPWRAAVRGCTKRCPICGSGKLFTGWFRMRERCPRCRLRLRRSEGQMSGDIGVNTIVSFGVLLVVLLGGVLLTWPEPPMVAIGIASLAVAALLPVAFVPFSKTIWLTAEILLRPLEPGEVDPGYGPPATSRFTSGPDAPM